jgi:L-aminopeptidase/D-esterase-like protein
LNLGEGLHVGALVALNSVGSALMPDGKTYWAWAFELDHELGGAAPPGEGLDLSDPVPEESRLSSLGRLEPGVNTTLAVVACSADLSTAECKRVAMMAHDGIARAVRPAHTPFDGDTVFALASGAIALGPGDLRAARIARIGSAAADCVSRAVARATAGGRAAGIRCRLCLAARDRLARAGARCDGSVRPAYQRIRPRGSSTTMASYFSSMGMRTFSSSCFQSSLS